MSYASLRDSFAAYLQGTAVADAATIHAEKPDALAPPAVTVEWESTAPDDLAGFVRHIITAVVWPATDLAARGHYESRDAIVTALVAALGGYSGPPGAVLRSEAWEAGLDERELGGQTIRVAVVPLVFQESNC